MSFTSIVKKPNLKKMAVSAVSWCQENASLIMKGAAIAAFVVLVSHPAFAADTKVNLEAGQTALSNSTDEIKKYLPLVRNLIYAIAGIVAVLGGISVYIKMNNEEQDVKKSIMLIVGACIFLVAAATALPLFFGQNQ